MLEETNEDYLFVVPCEEWHGSRLTSARTTWEQKKAPPCQDLRRNKNKGEAFCEGEVRFIARDLPAGERVVGGNRGDSSADQPTEVTTNSGGFSGKLFTLLFQYVCFIEPLSV